MSDTLQQELQQLLRTDAANAALTQLLDDYRRYHLVLVIVVSLFLIAALVLSVYSWRRFAKAPRSSRWRWTFERWTYFGFGVLGLIVAAFLALVVAANISNVVNPRAGFTGALGLLGSPSPGSNYPSPAATAARPGRATTPKRPSTTPTLLGTSRSRMVPRPRPRWPSAMAAG